jgi:large subunit ribosomal protein L29
VKPSELREKTDAELQELEQTMRRDLWKSRFSNYSNQLDDTDKVRRLRRDIARVKTLVHERANPQPAKAAKAAPAEKAEAAEKKPAAKKKAPAKKKAAAAEKEG